MSLLQAYVMFGIPALLLSLGGAALLWARWEEAQERKAGGRKAAE